MLELLVHAVHLISPEAQVAVVVVAVAHLEDGAVVRRPLGLDAGEASSLAGKGPADVGPPQGLPGHMAGGVEGGGGPDRGVAIEALEPDRRARRWIVAPLDLEARPSGRERV